MKNDREPLMRSVCERGSLIRVRFEIWRIFTAPVSFFFFVLLSTLSRIEKFHWKSSSLLERNKTIICPFYFFPSSEEGDDAQHQRDESAQPPTAKNFKDPRKRRKEKEWPSEDEEMRRLCVVIDVQDQRVLPSTSGTDQPSQKIKK